MLEAGRSRVTPAAELDQVVQDALEKAIDQLPETSGFDLVCFAQKIRRWSGQMQPATRANKKRGREFVRARGRWRH